MNRKGGSIRKGVSVGVTLLMLSLSFAVSLLERAELLDEPVAESEHNPATCPPGHDHTVCTQVGANLAAPADGHQQRLAHRVVRLAAPAEAQSVSSATFTEGNPSRAPPLV